MFAIGEKVVCIKKGAWTEVRAPLPPEMPKYNEICVVTWIGMDEGDLCIQIIGYPRVNMVANRFAPIQDNFAENALKNALKEGKELHERIYV